jgi:hypothetical protein
MIKRNKAIQAIQAMLITVALTLLLFYFLFNYLDTQRTKKIELINKKFQITKGIITGKQLYKGHSIDVKYYVGNSEYNESDGLDGHFEIGDSILVKYSIEEPNKMITECSNEFAVGLNDSIKIQNRNISSNNDIDKSNVYIKYIKGILLFVLIMIVIDKLQRHRPRS